MSSEQKREPTRDRGFGDFSAEGVADIVALATNHAKEGNSAHVGLGIL
ncbi:MAG: hypothetical protein SFV15_14260 [Polyangiaceae bacterium]|nr:hypothetical protein [Polyangiaceae bacterium]